MKALLKPLLIIIVLIVVMVAAFRVHTFLGLGLILLLLGIMAYTSRASLYAFRGTRAFAKDDFAQALIWYKKAYESRPCPDKHRIGYAYLLMRVGDSKLAEEVLKLILQSTKSRDTRVQAECNLATAYWLQGKKDEGIGLLTEVFEQYKNTLVYGNLGYFKILHGDLKEALAFNLEAYAYNPDDKTIIDNMALNYYLLGKFDQAEDMFKKLMLQPPKSAEPYYYYALTLKQQSKMEEAGEQIRLAQSKDLAFVTPLTREQIEQEAKQLFQ